MSKNNTKKLEQIYSNRFANEDVEKRNKLWETLVNYFFQKYVRKDSTVLDLGAGFCEFINHIECQKKIALDLNPNIAAHANQDVVVINEDVTRMDSIPDESVDVVFCSNFLEHLPSKDILFLTLEEVNRVLKPRGKFLILQPNIAVLHGKYWDFIDHYIPLSHTSLVEALLITNFRPIEVKARFLPYTTKSRFPIAPFLVRLYLKIPLAHYFLGKQAWIVCEKI